MQSRLRSQRQRVARGSLAFVLLVSMLTGVFQSATVAAFSGGDGTEGSPYQVSNCEDLQDVANDLDAYYVQTGLIDCALTHPGTEGFNTEGTWGDEKGFDPIGTALSPFEGVYDGGGYAIENVLIARVFEDHVGIFGYATGATIENLSVNDSTIYGQHYVGAVIGGIDGVAENESNVIDINVTDSLVAGISNAGGLVGTAGAYTLVDYSDANNITVNSASYVGGAIGSASGTNITRSTSSGLVQPAGSGSRIGGFVGSASCGTSVTSSTSTVEVVAPANTRVGGFVGSAQIGCEGSNSTFEAVAASGDVIADSQAGGFVGYNSYSDFYHATASGSVDAGDSSGGFAGVMLGVTDGDDTTGSINQSYSTGTVNAYDDAGGFVGLIEGGMISNSYTRSDVDASAQPGGFIGEVVAESSEPTFVTNSYAANSVSAGVYPQGFIGDDDAENAVITNSFWDKDYDDVPTSFGGEAKSTPQMKSVSTFTTSLGEEAWNFTGVWGMNAEINDGYPCLRYYSGEDGCVLTALSAAQDKNGDGIGDDLQDNISGYTNPFTGKWVVIDVGAGCEITSDDTEAEESFEVPDPDYVYASGMFEWEADCFSMGHTTTVTMYYYDISSANQVLRKYTASTGEYSTVDAIISQQTINGHSVTVVSYEIQDGGPLDDGPQDGSIIDPAGIGTVLSANTETQNSAGSGTSGGGALGSTGQSAPVVALFLVLAVSLGLLRRVYAKNKSLV